MSDFDPDGLHHDDIQVANLHYTDLWQPSSAIMWRGTVLYQLWFSNTGKRELRPVPTMEQAASIYSLDNVPVNESP